MRADLMAGLRQGLLVGTAVLALTLPPPHDGAPAQTLSAAAPAGLGAVPALPAGVGSTADLLRLHRWVVQSADNGGLAFMVIDKKAARVFVFDADGQWRATSKALLGLTPGDGSVPGIGTRAVADVHPAERTTPAGRFQTAPGHNANGETVVWIDYGAAVSLHRVRLNNPAERRLKRLASAQAGDRRISYGCVNVPARFFDRDVWPRFGRTPGLAYVLPEEQALEQVFRLPRGA